MDHLGYPRGASAHGMRDGPTKPMVSQKNAYARLVQQHHSSRFRCYLNHVAQAMLQEESGLGDLGFEIGSPPRRGLRDALGRNGPHAHAYSPIQTSQPDKPLSQGAEKINESLEMVRKALPSRQQRRDPNTSQEVEPALEGEATPKQGIIVVSDALGGRLVFNGSRDGASLQAFSGSVERDEQATVQNQQKKKIISPFSPRKQMTSQSNLQTTHPWPML